MSGRPKISDEGTFIFDKDDLEEFDALSLTSVIGDVTDSLKRASNGDLETGSDETEASPETDETDSGDPTINALLADFDYASSAEGHGPGYAAPSSPDVSRTDEVLMDSDILFSDADEGD